MASALFVAEKTEVCYLGRICTALHVTLSQQGKDHVTGREGQVGTHPDSCLNSWPGSMLSLLHALGLSKPQLSQSENTANPPLQRNAAKLQIKVST